MVCFGLELGLVFVFLSVTLYMLTLTPNPTGEKHTISTFVDLSTVLVERPM